MSSQRAICRLALVTLLLLACFALGCPNARTGPEPGSYGAESDAEAMEEEELGEAWKRSER